MDIEKVPCKLFSIVQYTLPQGDDVTADNNVLDADDDELGDLDEVMDVEDENMPHFDSIM